jgi:hypothetical protein
MFTVIIKFNNGSSKNFEYSEEQISTKLLTSDISKQLYPDTYNPKIDQYVKLIYMGKILGIDDVITFDSTKQEQTFHCVVKKIPDDAFIVEKSKFVEDSEVAYLLENKKLTELLLHRTVFEFIMSHLDSPEKLIDIISGNSEPIKHEHLTTKYASQIQVLKEMGFTDENELAVLLANANGNLENVINILMG